MEDVGIYKTAKYTAYIYPKKIIICTNLQTFRIIQMNHHSSYYLDMLKLAIINNKITKLSQLAEYGENKLAWENCTSWKLQ